MSRLFNFLHDRRTKPTSEGFLRKNLAIQKNPTNTLESIALDLKENSFTKWWHYLSFYDEKLGILAENSRNGNISSPIRILEIGVWQGGSLDLWREFFGPTAIIFGIDINAPMQKITSGKICLGSQTDTDFLKKVVDEMGGIDIVIDDGSHLNSDVITTFKFLFPLLSDEGLYFIEDLHTSYWPVYGGGLRRKKTSIEMLKNLIDYMNSEYFNKPIKDVKNFGEIKPTRVEIADSIAMVKKGETFKPELFFGGTP